MNLSSTLVRPLATQLELSEEWLNEGDGERGWKAGDFHTM